MAYLKLIRLAVFVALLLMAGAVLAFADDHYGAIAYSTNNGRYGYTYDYSTQASAEAEALKNCGDLSCTIILWFKNSCAALAIGDGYSYGVAWASGRGDAETSAMTYCSQNGKGCSIAQWVCTSR
jgi:Domain of unknown function (DUF4189)